MRIDRYKQLKTGQNASSQRSNPTNYITSNDCALGGDVMEENGLSINTNKLNAGSAWNAVNLLKGFIFPIEYLFRLDRS